jgi:hypothetical protein
MRCIFDAARRNRAGLDIAKKMRFDFIQVPIGKIS